MPIKKGLTKKISFLLIVSVLSVNLTFLTVPTRVEATGWPVVDFVGNFLKTSNFTWEKIQPIINKLLIKIARNAAKRLISNVTQATVMWINGDSGGKPAFISNPSKFLFGAGGVTDRAIGDFIQNEPGLNFLCKPFQLQVKLALQLGYGANLTDKIGCTLNQALDNIDNAGIGAQVTLGANGGTVTAGTGKILSEGGWDSWLRTTLTPQNNPIGAYVTTKAELDLSIRDAQGNKIMDLGNSKGALSFNRCTDGYYGADGNLKGSSDEYTEGAGEGKGSPPIPNSILFPGSGVLLASQNQRQADLTTGLGDIPNYNNPQAQAQIPAKITKKTKCAVKTPGSMFTEMIGQKATSDVRQSEIGAAMADGIDAILGAIFTKLFDKATKQLNKGVLDGSLTDFNDYNSYLNDQDKAAYDVYYSEMAKIQSEQDDLLNNLVFALPEFAIPSSTGMFDMSTLYNPFPSLVAPPTVYPPYTKDTPWKYDPGSTLTPWDYTPLSATSTAWIYGKNSNTSPWRYNSDISTAPHLPSEPWAFDPNSTLTPNDYTPDSSISSQWTYGPGANTSSWSFDPITNSWSYDAGTSKAWNYNPGTAAAPSTTNAPWAYDTTSKLTPWDYNLNSPTNKPWVYGPNSTSTPWTYNSNTKSWTYDPTASKAWTFNPKTSTLWTYNTSAPTAWNYIQITPPPTTITSGGIGFDQLARAKNNANILINSLLKSELAYQNNYKIAQNVLTGGKNVFATSSVCNMNYNRSDYVLRSSIIRSNVVTNIDGTPDSNRSIASIPWNLRVVDGALKDSNANIILLNKASSGVNAASSIDDITNVMIPVNSTSFNTDAQIKMVDQIKTWLRGVQGMYNSLLCPIDLTKVLQITSI